MVFGSGSFLALTNWSKDLLVAGFPVIGNIALKFRGFPGVLPSFLHFCVSPGWLQLGISQGRRGTKKERETRNKAITIER